MSELPASRRTLASRRVDWIMRAAGVFALAFGLLTLREGGAVLLGEPQARAAAGNYVAFVLWFNVVAGVAYVASGVGMWAGRRWATVLAIGIAASTAIVFAALGVHIALGGPYERRTIIAMTLRTLVWTGLAVLGLWRSSGPRGDTPLGG